MSEAVLRIAANRRHQVDLIFEEKLEQGLPFGGSSIQLRKDDQDNIDAMVSKADLAIRGIVQWPPVRWRLRDNSFSEVLTPQQMISLGDAASNYVLTLRVAAWAIKDAITTIEHSATLTDEEKYLAIREFPLRQGWPS